MMLKTIEIDLEIYKRLEAERKSFDETHNEILRRLLKIDQSQNHASLIQMSNKEIFGLKEETDSLGSFYPDSLEENEDITDTITQYQRTIMEKRLSALLSEAPTDWIFEGVRLAEGTKLRKWYRGQQYYAVIANGSISFGDKLYYAPSSAAMAITNGSPVNGWLFWEFFDEADGSWKKLTELREDVSAKTETKPSCDAEIGNNKNIGLSAKSIKKETTAKTLPQPGKKQIPSPKVKRGNRKTKSK